MCMRAVYSQACKCNRNIAHFFGSNERNVDSNMFSFGVSYNSVAQKWRILAIFGELLRYRDLKHCLEAKILN